MAKGIAVEVVPKTRLVIVSSNLSAGTTGDTSSMSWDNRGAYTGMVSNYQVEVINKRIRKDKEDTKP